MATSKRVVIDIPELKPQSTVVHVIGTSELIVSCFSEKSKRQIADKQAGKVKVREKRNPKEEYEAAFYRLPNGRPAFPVIPFKKAMADVAATLVEGVSKSLIQKAVFIKGTYVPRYGVDLVEIHGKSEPYMRTDIVRLAGIGSPADLRYRPGFPEWWCELEIEHDENQITVEAVIRLLAIAGFNGGVGELRPQKTGWSFGRWKVANSEEAKALKNGHKRRKK